MWLAHCQRSPSELQVTANKIVLLLILLYSPHKIDRWSVLYIYIYIYTMYILYIMYVIYIWYYILYALDVSLANVTTDYLDIWNQFTNLLNFTWMSLSDLMILVVSDATIVSVLAWEIWIEKITSLWTVSLGRAVGIKEENTWSNSLSKLHNSKCQPVGNLRRTYFIF